MRSHRRRREVFQAEEVDEVAMLAGHCAQRWKRRDVNHGRTLSTFRRYGARRWTLHGRTFTEKTMKWPQSARNVARPRSAVQLGRL